MLDQAINNAVLFTISFALYLIPTIVAAWREHKNLIAIGMTNLLLGWSVIGWIVALIWALKK